MSDVPAPAAPVPVARRSYPRLTKYASIFISGCGLIIAAVTVYDWVAPTSLPDCDGSTVQSAIRDIFHENVKMEVSTIEGFTAGAKTPTSLACTADLTFADHDRARLTYDVTLEKDKVMVRTKEATKL